MRTSPSAELEAAMTSERAVNSPTLFPCFPDAMNGTWETAPTNKPTHQADENATKGAKQERPTHGKMTTLVKERPTTLMRKNARNSTLATCGRELSDRRGHILRQAWKSGR